MNRISTIVLVLLLREYPVVYRMGGNLVFLDVAVTHPAGASVLRRAARRSGTAAEEAEQEKMRKYQVPAELHQATVVPFVVESYGAMGAWPRSVGARSLGTRRTTQGWRTSRFWPVSLLRSRWPCSAAMAG